MVTMKLSQSSLFNLKKKITLLTLIVFSKIEAATVVGSANPVKMLVVI